MLPSSFKQKDKDNEDDTGKPAKRTKLNQDNSRLVQNSGRISEWTTESPDDYQKFFAGKHLEMRPKFKGRPMCQRFHSKGHCFSDCINAVTHVPSTDLPSNLGAEYNRYCIKCRQDF